MLEAMIDAVGVAQVLDDLGAVCVDKAEHIRANWQDATLARQWDTITRTINRAVLSIARLEVWR